ncbi:5'/3'-nucleotidase SurE [Glutamicibacter endophyticus]
MKKIFAWVAAATITLSSLTAGSWALADQQESSAGSLAGQRILLTNDDSMQASDPSGKDGLGLYEVRRALCAAGADVAVIGPWDYASGAGTKVTNSGVVTAQQRTELPAGYSEDCASAPTAGPVFGLCVNEGVCTTDSPSATPADTVKFALHGGLNALVGWDKAPDLVVSGMNSGPNVSSSVNDSGTIGAALAANDAGVPAVALSAGIDATGRLHTETYTAGADFAATYIAKLGTEGQLSAQHVVNINYPDASGQNQPSGVKFTRVGLGTVAVHSYTPREGNSFTVGLGICPDADYCHAETRRDADSTALLAQGYITVSSLTSDRTLSSAESNKLRAFVNAHS